MVVVVLCVYAMHAACEGGREGGGAPVRGILRPEKYRVSIPGDNLWAVMCRPQPTLGRAGHRS